MGMRRDATVSSGLRLVRVAVPLAVGLLHVHAELVLLVTAHVGVAHEVQRVVVDAHHRRHKVQLDLETTAHGKHPY